MQAFKQLNGLVVPIDRPNVDTDAIIPKQFLKSIKRSGFGPNLFDEWRYLDQGQPDQDNSTRPLNPDFVLKRETKELTSAGERRPKRPIPRVRVERIEMISVMMASSAARRHPRGSALRGLLRACARWGRRCAEPPADRDRCMIGAAGSVPDTGYAAGSRRRRADASPRRARREPDQSSGPTRSSVTALKHAPHTGTDTSRRGPRRWYFFARSPVLSIGRPMQREHTKR